MKLKTEAFPYPVLSPDTSLDSDYLETAFQCTIETKKDKDIEGNICVNFEYSFILSNEEILTLIEEKKASFMLEVTCSATGFKQMYSLENSTGSLLIPIEKLYNRVVVYPLVVATSVVNNYSSEDLNLEYLVDNDTGGQDFRKFKLNPGDMIAFDEPMVKYFDYEPLGIRSLLRVVLDEEQNQDCYSVDPNQDDELIVRMGTDIKALWDNPQTKEYLFMPVIKDCILVALDEYRVNKEAIQEKKWAKLFLETIDAQHGIDEDTSVDDINLLAQKVSKKFGLMKIKRKVSEE